MFFSIISGALLSAAFAPVSLWWLAPVALALHMYVLNRSSHPFFNSFLFALVFNAIALHWTSIYVGSIPWIILTLGQAVLFLPLGFVKRYSIAVYPLIFLLLEEVRGRFPFGGFGWLRIAYSQADAPYRGIAAYGGAAGLSAITLCASLVILALMNARLTLVPMIPLALLLIPIQMHQVGTVKVLMVQGNVPELGLNFNSRATQVFYNHVKESDKALKINSDVDFILWPENAVDVDPFTNSHIKDALNGFGKPLIVGAVVRESNEIHNVSILWTKTSQNLYVKQHLTPFGEYIPLRALARKISPFVDMVADFSPGNTSTLFTVGRAKVAPIICFELIDDELVATSARNSNLIVVQTNSATFGKSSESAQQLAITRVRAIEHGKNILSVSTTGTSAHIDAKGEVLQATAMHVPAHLFAVPDLLDSQTPRDNAGQWALGGGFIWLWILSRGSKYRNRR